MVETFGIICGVILGLFGSVFSVVQFFYQRYKDKEQAAIEAARDKAQDEKDKAQAEREAARDKAQAEKDKAQAEREAARDKAQDLKDRLFFLAQLIVDKDIPRESRQIFFDEYIAKGGNGSFVKWWLENR
jgi:F0F1-type ATP synthase membrane subunit b/b'